MTSQCYIAQWATLHEKNVTDGHVDHVSAWDVILAAPSVASVRKGKPRTGSFDSTWVSLLCD